MAFGDVTASTNGNAGALFSSTAAAAGVKGVGNLSDIAQLQLVLANLLLADPSTVAIPAGDVLAGTFGANKAGGADTGAYVFPGNVSLAAGILAIVSGANLVDLTITGGGVTGTNSTNTVAITDTWNTTGAPTGIKYAITNTASDSASLLMNLLAGVAGATSIWNVRVDGLVTQAGGLTIAGALSGVTSAAFSTLLSSLTALATPSALTSTSLNVFASTVSGATLMGFGTTGDVTLKNRAGTDVIVVGPNSTAVSVAGALTLLAGALSSSATLGIGYKTGAGGVVTQASNRSTVVTLNTTVGQITGNAASLAASTSATFTVINTTVAATDLILLSVVSGPTANTSVFSIGSVGSGLFTIRAANVSTAAGDVGAPVLNFAVLKGAIS